MERGMNTENLRSFKVNITWRIGREEREEIYKACQEAEEAREYFKKKAINQGECCGVRIYKENEKEVERKFKRIPKQVLVQIAIRTARQEFAPRAVKKEKFGYPLNKTCFKFYKHGSTCALRFRGDFVVMFDVPIPEHFTRKYAFDKTDYKWGCLEIINGDLFVTLVYDVVIRGECGPQLFFQFAHC